MCNIYISKEYLPTIFTPPHNFVLLTNKAFKKTIIHKGITKLEMKVKYGIAFMHETENNTKYSIKQEVEQ